MTDDLKQEFDAARIKHLLFKSKLRSFLYGSDTAQGPIRDPNQCAMGQWIAARVLTAFGHQPASRELDQLHRRIHQEANRLMDLRDTGQADEAINGLAAINQMAEQIIRLLDKLEAALRAE